MLSEEHIKTLVTLGLSGRQARICLALSLKGISTVKEITETTNIARPDTYRALVELENKGLIEKTLSNPAKYKILPLPEVLAMLMGEKEAESIRLQERSASLIRDYRRIAEQKPAEDSQFVLVPSGKAFANRLDKLLDNCEKSISIISSQKMLDQILDCIHERLTQKKGNEIQVRVVTEKQRSKSLTNNIYDLQKRVNLELRLAAFLPSFSLATFDQKETLLIMNTPRENNRAFATYSNNSSLVELSQSYFNDAWFSASESSGIAFKRTQLQFDSLFANMLNGFAYCKMVFDDGQPVDFIYIQINKAFERITGLNRAQVIGKKISKIIPDIREQPELIEIYGRVSCTGKAEQHELFFKPKNVWIHISVYAPIKGYVALVFEDITDRKKAEEALLESKALIDTTFASINEAIIIFNLKGEVLKFNEAYLRLYGFKENDAPKNLREFSDVLDAFYSDGNQVNQVNDFNSFLALNGQTGVREYIIKRKETGQTWVVNHTYAPLFDKNGELFGMVLSLQDVTEQKRNEEKLQRLNRTLKAIVSANQALIHATDESTFLKEGCRLIQENCGYQTVLIGLAQDDEAKTVIPVAYAGFEKGYPESFNITWAESGGHQSLAGKVILTGKPQFFNNVASEPSLKGWRAEALKRGFASSIAVPLKSNGKTFGAIVMFTLEPINYSEDEIELLSEMADVFAYGISMLSLRQEKEQLKKEAKVR